MTAAWPTVHLAQNRDTKAQAQKAWRLSDAWRPLQAKRWAEKANSSNMLPRFWPQANYLSAFPSSRAETIRWRKSARGKGGSCLAFGLRVGDSRYNREEKKQ